MKIQTFSIVVGSQACDANCRFCVSHTTGFDELPKVERINTSNFRKAVKLADKGGCTTVLFTGKGEPTLYPEEITEYLQILKDMGDPFPFIEIQTNAIRLGQAMNVVMNHNQMSDTQEALLNHLTTWQSLGLNTIAISTTGTKNEWNRQTYLHHRGTEYPDLGKTVTYLNNHDFTVRLCVMMQKGMVDSPERLLNVIDWCRDHEVAQLTARPIRKPSKHHADPLKVINDYDRWVETYGLDEDVESEIRNYVDDKGTHIMTLMHGGHEAKVYDFNGQNICLSDCLTVEAKADDIRTLIFYADGRLTFDWQYRGARLL